MGFIVYKLSMKIAYWLLVVFVLSNNDENLSRLLLIFNPGLLSFEQS